MTVDGLTRTAAGDHGGVPRSAPRVGSAPLRLTVATAAFVASLTSMWSAVRVDGMQVADACLALWAVVVLLGAGPRAFLGTPRWVVLPVLGAGVAFVLQLTLTVGSPELLALDLELFVRLMAATVLVPLVIVASAGRWASALGATIQGWVASAAVSVLAELYVRAGGVVPVAEHTIQSDRGFGLTLHPNSFGLTCVLVLPFVLAGIRSKGPIPAVLAVPYSVLMLVGLRLSDSRSALAVGFVVIVLALGYLITSARAWPVGLPLVLVAAAVGLVQLPGVVATTRLAGLGSAAESDALRNLERESTLLIVRESPIYGHHIAAVGTGVMTLLGLLVAGGVLMALGYYAYFAAALTTMVRGARDGELVAGLAVISTLSFLAVGLAQPSTVERYTFWPVGIGLAAHAALRRRRAVAAGPPDSADASRRGATEVPRLRGVAAP